MAAASFARACVCETLGLSSEPLTGFRTRIKTTAQELRIECMFPFEPERK